MTQTHTCLWTVGGNQGARGELAQKKRAPHQKALGARWLFKPRTSLLWGNSANRYTTMLLKMFSFFPLYAIKKNNRKTTTTTKKPNYTESVWFSWQSEGQMAESSHKMYKIIKCLEIYFSVRFFPFLFYLFFKFGFETKIPLTYSCIKTLWKLSELRQRIAEQHVRMRAVEQNTDDGLGGTSVVNDLETHRSERHKINRPIKNKLWHETGSGICMLIINIMNINI